MIAFGGCRASITGGILSFLVPLSAAVIALSGDGIGNASFLITQNAFGGMDRVKSRFYLPGLGASDTTSYENGLAR